MHSHATDGDGGNYEILPIFCAGAKYKIHQGMKRTEILQDTLCPVSCGLWYLGFPYRISLNVYIATGRTEEADTLLLYFQIVKQNQ
jgi:hypothetical protein